MKNKHELIKIRELTSQRMDLSSEEQDRIFYQISFDFLIDREMEEVVETISYMTSNGGQECLVQIVEKLTQEGDFGYALNVILLIKSTLSRDERYIRILEAKIRMRDVSQNQYIINQIQSDELKKYADSIIDNPKILDDKKVSIDDNFSPKNQILIIDSIREVMSGYVGQGVDKFNKVRDFLEVSDLEALHQTIQEKIKKELSIAKLGYLNEFIKGIEIMGFSHYVKKIDERIIDIEMSSKSNKEVKSIERAFYYILNSRLLKRDKKSGIVSLSDLKLIDFLENEILTSKIVIVREKIPETPALFILSGKRYVYDPTFPTKQDRNPPIINKLKKYLANQYAKNPPISNDFIKDSNYLDGVRQNISNIDSELLCLLDERMQLAEGVAAYKREHGLLVFDAVREAEILTKIPPAYLGIWREIMDASKKVQEEYIKKA